MDEDPTDDQIYDTLKILFDDILDKGGVTYSDDVVERIARYDSMLLVALGLISPSEEASPAAPST